MKVLLDSHTILWFMLNSPKLSPLALTTIRDPLNQVHVSPASHWELAIKVSLGKLRITEDFSTLWFSVLRKAKLLPIEISHTSALIGMPFHHKDPFDRLLVCQAMVERCAIVSNDAALDAYGVPRLW